MRSPGRVSLKDLSAILAEGTELVEPSDSPRAKSDAMLCEMFEFPAGISAAEKWIRLTGAHARREAMITRSRRPRGRGRPRKRDIDGDDAKRARMVLRMQNIEREKSGEVSSNAACARALKAVAEQYNDGEGGQLTLFLHLSEQSLIDSVSRGMGVWEAHVRARPGLFGPGPTDDWRPHVEWYEGGYSGEH